MTLHALKQNFNNKNDVREQPIPGSSFRTSSRFCEHFSIKESMYVELPTGVPRIRTPSSEETRGTPESWGLDFREWTPKLAFLEIECQPILFFLGLNIR